jgi:hypothetical protein
VKYKGHINKKSYSLQSINEFRNYVNYIRIINSNLQKLDIQVVNKYYKLIILIYWEKIIR